MVLYRIASRVHARDLTGTGAMLYGGRWNSKGVRLVYTSESLSLATLETVVNLSGDKLKTGLHVVELEFPKTLDIIKLKKLPPEWNSYPYRFETMVIGNEFVKKGGLCLQVPSAIVPTESNFLLNPEHLNFDKIKILDSRPLLLDQRLLAKKP